MTGYTKQVTDEELRETIDRISENLDSTKELKKWVVYPDVPFDITIEEYKSIINMQEKNEVINELPSDLIPYAGSASTMNVGYLNTEDAELKDVEAQLDALDKENLNEEKKELTEEEKHELFIKQLKESKRTFFPLKRPVKTTLTKTTIEQPYGGSYRKIKKEESQVLVTNEIINPYGTSYKKKRRAKNKEQRKSRKANR